MKISKLEYVKLQSSMYAKVYGCNALKAKELVDEVLKLNHVTISDEPEVKPMDADEFLRLCERGSIEELKKRGLVC